MRPFLQVLGSHPDSGGCVLLNHYQSWHQQCTQVSLCLHTLKGDPQKGLWYGYVTTTKYLLLCAVLINKCRFFTSWEWKCQHPFLCSSSNGICPLSWLVWFWANKILLYTIMYKLLHALFLNQTDLSKHHHADKWVAELVQQQHPISMAYGAILVFWFSSAKTCQTRSAQ